MQYKTKMLKNNFGIELEDPIQNTIPTAKFFLNISLMIL